MIGEAMGWKYDHKPGIETKDNKLTKWPITLGTKPTKQEVDVIVSEYETYKQKADALTVTEDIEIVANKLEEVIDFIENGTPISQQTKDWLGTRKALRT